MSISHVHPMCLLVVSLFFLPLLAQSAGFNNCRIYYGGIRATGMKEFVEEGRKSFNLTCSTGTALTKGFMLAVVRRGFIHGPVINIQPYNLCDLITCPVAPGSFVITIRKLYHVPVTTRIHALIVVNAGPDKIVDGEPVVADGSMCVNIYDAHK